MKHNAADESDQRRPRASLACGVITFALIFPTLVTWLYFVALADAPAALQYTASGVGKAIQFLLPVVWVFLICRRRPNWNRPQPGDLLLGAGTGLAIGVAMCALYFTWMQASPWFTPAVDPIRAKVASLGIDSLGKYLTLMVFYALVHSLLEEYYWRWFVFAELRKLIPLVPAIVVAALGFAAHHVLVLGGFFGYASPLTWVFSLGVAIGGAIWAWQYDRMQSLWGIWVSHAFVDAAIFLVGLSVIASAW